MDDGTVLDVHLRPDGSAEAAAQRGLATAAAEDVTTVAGCHTLSLANGDLDHLAAGLAATDVHQVQALLTPVGSGGRLADSIVGLCDLRRSYRGERAATQHIAVDGTTQHIDPREVSHRTGRGAVGFFHFSTDFAIAVEVELILTDAGACTVNITTMQPLRILNVSRSEFLLISRIVGQTNYATIDRYLCFAPHVSVLTATVDRAHDERCLTGLACIVAALSKRTDGDISLVDIA